MKTHLIAGSAALAALVGSIVLPTLAFAQYYSYPTYQNCSGVYGSSYSYYSSSYCQQPYQYQTYGYQTGYQQPYQYQTYGYQAGYQQPYQYQMYGYQQPYQYQTYGYQTGYQQPVIYISTGGDVYNDGYNPIFGTNSYGYQPSYGYSGGYGYNSTPGSYGYSPYSSYYNMGYNGYSNCNSNVGGVCGQDRSIGLGAALYNTVLPYNPYTGL